MHQLRHTHGTILLSGTDSFGVHGLPSSSCRTSFTFSLETDLLLFYICTPFELTTLVYKPILFYYPCFFTCQLLNMHIVKSNFFDKKVHKNTAFFGRCGFAFAVQTKVWCRVSDLTNFLILRAVYFLSAGLVTKYKASVSVLTSGLQSC